MEIRIPEFSLIALIGASGSGKTTFANKFFGPNEILSLERFQDLVSNGEQTHSSEEDSSETLHYVLGKRLKNKLLTVIDAQNVEQTGRKGLRLLAKKYHCQLLAIVLDMPADYCISNQAQRGDAKTDEVIVRNQIQQLRKSLNYLSEEGFRQVHVFKAEEELESLEISRQNMPSDKKEENGPFDIIGDVHGCIDELKALLVTLDYSLQSGKNGHSDDYIVTHPKNRRLVFVGDLVDRGPDSAAVLQLVMGMVRSGIAFCVPGNHDVKLVKKLDGRNVKLKHGLAETIEQLDKEPEEFREEIRVFVKKLSSHLVFDEGKLVVAHAGLREEMHGRNSGETRAFCMYGETTGETDEFGLPIRYNWAEEYRGQATIVYGHTPIPEAQWLNRTINIDTGCVFGGKLTALRYPENELVAIPAGEIYCEPVRPLEMNVPEVSNQHDHDEVLDFAQFSDRTLAVTRLHYNITLHEQQALAALEIINRYGVNPKWLIYLPPAISPPKTSKMGEYLEHPAEAFAYYARKGLSAVIMEEKYMGSRAVLILCKDEAVVQKRFGIENEGIGIVYTRTGRRFFEDTKMEQALLRRLRDAMDISEIWEGLETDWICLDCELLPWSLKAADRLINKYATIGAAAACSSKRGADTLSAASARGVDIGKLGDRMEVRQRLTAAFREAYGHCASQANGIEDLRLIPLHILATEGHVHMDKPHTWHLETITMLCGNRDQVLQAPAFQLVDLESPSSIREATASWESYTANGGEGMVIKPLDFLCEADGELVQPAMKVRGKEYLRIIYGPEYTRPEHLLRLRKRSLKTKRSLILRELALGHESLSRFVEGAPLVEVYQIVFTILGIESTAMDPRL